MLDRNAMAQLEGLREELEAQNEHVDATVKGTQHRYGFAVTDDGREVFIPPDEMLKVLPGDKVAICIRPATPVKGKQDKPGRTVAEIERLIESGLNEFVGHIVQKGKATLARIPAAAKASIFSWIWMDSSRSCKGGKLPIWGQDVNGQSQRIDSRGSDS